MNKTYKALRLLKEVKLVSFDSDTYEVEQLETRLKAKKELLQPKKKSKKKKTDKKKRK